MTEPETNRRLRRLLGEFVLIVAGVTVALSADSLWDYWQDRVSEREYLEQLLSDLAESEQRFEEAAELEAQQSAAGQSALNAIASGGAIEPDSAQAWLIERRALFYSDPRPLTGTLTALVETGDLRVIRDPAKRQGVIAYLSQISADKTEFDRFVDQTMGYIAQFREVGMGSDFAWTSLGASSVRALVNDTRNPALPVALEGLIISCEIRIVYLNRMLEATRQAAEVLGQP